MYGTISPFLSSTGCVRWSVWNQHQQQTAVSHLTVCPSHLHGVRKVHFSFLSLDASMFNFFSRQSVLSFFRCPDTNKPLGLMLLNGLTKLINEYKEVKLQMEMHILTVISYSIIWFMPSKQHLSLQDPKLLCVAYSAVGKLSRYNKIILSFFLKTLPAWCGILDLKKH